jgi:signal peptidase I
LKLDTVISTQTIKARSPSAAFLLSLICTGLGQAYNGDMAKGAAFAFMRSLSLALIPVAILSKETESSIHIFIALVLVCVLVSLASPFESLIRAMRKKKLPLKPYNSPLWYALFVSANIILTAAAVALLAAFYSIAGISHAHEGPLLKQGDRVLIKLYAPGGYARGDLVMLDDGSAARVVALAGDTVRYTGNIFYINGKALPMGILSDQAIRRFTPDTGDVVSETNGGEKYPVRFRRSASITLDDLTSPVPGDRLLVARDRRLGKNFARIVPASAAWGRIEGIICSKKFRTIGMDSCADLR